LTPPPRSEFAIDAHASDVRRVLILRARGTIGA
jgi:hypothetical protein